MPILDIALRRIVDDQAGHHGRAVHSDIPQ
jgi:hypothetical protein